MAAQKYDELSQLVKVLGRTIRNQERLTEDSRSLLDVVVDYTYALDTLDRYDYQGFSTVIDEDSMAQEEHKDSIKYLILRPDGHLYSKWDSKVSLIF